CRRARTRLWLRLPACPALPCPSQIPRSRSSFSRPAETKKEAGEPPFSDVYELSPEASLGLARNLGECGLVDYREVGQDFAIELDRGLLEPAHEHRVAHPAFARGRVDARDPQRAELALAHAPVAVGVLAGLHHGLFGYTEDVLAAAAKPLGLIEDLLVT